MVLKLCVTIAQIFDRKRYNKVYNFSVQCLILWREAAVFGQLLWLYNYRSFNSNLENLENHLFIPTTFQPNFDINQCLNVFGQ